MLPTDEGQAGGKDPRDPAFVLRFVLRRAARCGRWDGAWRCEHSLSLSALHEPALASRARVPTRPAALVDAFPTFACGCLACVPWRLTACNPPSSQAANGAAALPLSALSPLPLSVSNVTFLRRASRPHFEMSSWLSAAHLCTFYPTAKP
eukprot:2735162-Pleurochrysis_carterae.AAC.3